MSEPVHYLSQEERKALRFNPREGQIYSLSNYALQRHLTMLEDRFMAHQLLPEWFRPLANDGWSVLIDRTKDSGKIIYDPFVLQVITCPTCGEKVLREELGEHAFHKHLTRENQLKILLKSLQHEVILK